MQSNWHVYLLVIVYYCAPINSYLNVRLEDKLCTPGAKPTPSPPVSDLTLMEDNESAAIFTQQWNATASAVVDCEFIVYSHPDVYRIPKGTYIAITDLKFRKNPETNECIDYIQFIDGANDPPSERICEATDANGIRKPPKLEYRQRNIRVVIHIEDRTDITEPLELRMVMTAHSQCNNKNDVLCDPKVPYSCISRYFVNDNITNCLFPCLDESSCWPETTFPPPNISHSVNNRIDDNEPNCVTVGILEQKLKEQREILSAVLQQREDSFLNQLDDKINVKNSGHKPQLLTDMKNEGVDVNRQPCLTKEAFEETLLLNSQLILKAIEAPEERFQRMELFMFAMQQQLLQLMAKLDSMPVDPIEPPKREN